MSFRFERLEIPDVVLIEATVSTDERGFFKEMYRFSDFASAGLPRPFVQDNVSRSTRGVLRGLHYQKPPKAQTKLIGVVRGVVYDVVVDLRKGSPAYGRWVGVELSDHSHRLLYVPEGFAHGFCVLSDLADVMYKVTAEYAPELERGVVWNDPDIGVRWPIKAPRVSARDAGLPRLREIDHDFLYPHEGL
jgi:dTDP-4-dehydrorhamnose 3,5-epimerase